MFSYERGTPVGISTGECVPGKDDWEGRPRAAGDDVVQGLLLRKTTSPYGTPL